MTQFGSSFDPDTYRVSVQFAENTEEKRLNRMERELGYGGEEDSSGPDGNPDIRIDMSDVRAMLEAGTCDNSVEAHSGISKMTDAVSTGVSTVNSDCPVRNREKHQQTHLENCKLKGQILEKEAETTALKNEVNGIAESMTMLLSRRGTPEEILSRMQDISGRHSGLTASKPAPADDPDSSKPNVRFADSTEGNAGAKAVAPEENEGAEACAKESTSCVTPAQQRREPPQ